MLYSSQWSEVTKGTPVIYNLDLDGEMGGKGEKFTVKAREHRHKHFLYTA